jgi:Pathogenicity locus
MWVSEGIMSPEATNADLESVPGIGPQMAADLRTLGVFSVADLRGRDPEQLYRTLEARVGGHVDRCVLYVYRCAVYYASSEELDPEKLKWWHWKDKK